MPNFTWWEKGSARFWICAKYVVLKAKCKSINAVFQMLYNVRFNDLHVFFASWPVDWQLLCTFGRLFVCQHKLPPRPSVLLLRLMVHLLQLYSPIWISRYLNKGWGCVIPREIDFLLKFADRLLAYTHRGEYILVVVVVLNFSESLHARKLHETNFSLQIQLGVTKPTWCTSPDKTHLFFYCIGMPTVRFCLSFE